MECPEWLSASGLSYTRVVSREVGPAVNALKGCVGPSGWIVSHRCDSRQRGLRDLVLRWHRRSCEVPCLPECNIFQESIGEPFRTEGTRVTLEKSNIYG